jgi:alpha-N-acetylglucosamine transferase
MKKIVSVLISFLFLFNCVAQIKTNTYPSLLQLCKELRLLERTSLPNGVPDYRKETIVKIQQTLVQYKPRHTKMDTAGWTIEQKVDYVLLLAEMNALDYNCRILQPWVRDPAFYAIVWNEQSDTPDHEGPNSFAAVELWKYSFPLSIDDEKKLTTQLKIIPPLYEQAKINLTGNAKD